MVLYEAMQKTSHFPPYLCQGRSCQCIVQEYGYMCIYEYILTVALSNCICGTLRSWGHLSFHYYLVKTGPMLRIFGSEIFSLIFLDILNANLSEIETLVSHL